MALHPVFFSYHFDKDATRAWRVRDMGVVAANKPASADDWEAVMRHGDSAIRSWINNQLARKSCLVVLIGPETAGRQWIEYEIRQAWTRGLGVVGVHIHGLPDATRKTARKGANPFVAMNMARTVKTYDPRGITSTGVHSYIKENLAAWVAEAILNRNVR